MEERGEKVKKGRVRGKQTGRGIAGDKQDSKEGQRDKERKENERETDCRQRERQKREIGTERGKAGERVRLIWR